MIEIINENNDQRPDIISFCTNCQEVSGSQIMICPKCGHKRLKKKQINFYIGNIMEKQYPVTIITKSELINHFIPKQIVDKLTDENMIYIARFAEKEINKSEVISRAFSNFKELCIDNK